MALTEEWHALVKTLQNPLCGWPRELIPLVASYVRARMHEWLTPPPTDKLVIGPREIESHRELKPETLAWYPPYLVRSKYAVDTGPSRWAIDVSFSPWIRDRSVEIGFTGSGCYFYGTRLTQKRDCVAIELNGCLTMRNNLATYRIYMSIEKETQWAVFEFGEFGSAVRRKRSEELERIFMFAKPIKFDLFYPAVTIARDCACTVTLVDDP